jgi:membrane-associated phospholipid phosphatase
LDRLLEPGYAAIAAFQSLRSEGLDALAYLASFVGDEPFYLLLLPALYWGLNRTLALRLTVLFLVSAWLNEGLKALLDQPRPSPERVAILEPRSTGGVPSGHAQGSVVVWGYLVARWPLASSTRRWPLLAVAAVVILLIGLSRLYLGTHFPHDVLGGWLVGGLLLLAVLGTGPRVEDRVRRVRPGTWAALALAGPLLLLLLVPVEEATAPAAALMGVGLGAVWERGRIRFSTEGTAWSRAGRLALGLLVALGIWAGLRGMLAPLGEPGRALRYALLGLWVTGGGPWLFVRLGLAGREAPGRAETLASEGVPRP